jgi:hypothetical protein
MPKKLYKYTLQYGAETLDCEPTNWADFQVAVAREDHTLKRDFTTDLTFSGAASKLLQSAYASTSKATIVTLKVERLRSTDWAYIHFRTLRANFIGFTLDKGLSTLSFYEDTLRLSIENLKDVEYTLDVPQTRTIGYDGVGKVRNNTLSLFSGECSTIGTTAIRFLPPSTHQSEYSTNVTFLRPDGLEYGRTRFKALQDCVVSLKVHLGALAISCYGSYTYAGGKMQVIRLRGGAFTVLYEYNATSSKSIRYGIRDVFEIPEQNHSFGLFEGDEIFLAYLPSLGANSVSVSYGLDTLNTYIQVTDTSDSPYQDYRITALTPEEVCRGILTKMGINATVTIPTISSYWDVYLSGKDSLAQKADAKIVTTWKDIVEFMYMLGYAVDYTDTSVVFSLITDNYQDIEAEEVDILSDFSTVDDDTNVFSSVVVGYDTSDSDVEDGEKDIMCKNTFTLNKNVDKKLEITTKYKASPYTIESAIKSAREDSSKTKSTDSDIFVFVVKKDTYEISYTSEADTYISNMLVLETLSGYTTYNVLLNQDYTYKISGFLDGGKIHLLFVKNGVGIAYENILDDTTFADYILESVGADSVYIVNKDTTPFSIQAIRKNAELYRDRVSTTISETNYNEPISPMRILLRHSRYLGISMVGLNVDSYTPEFYNIYDDAYISEDLVVEPLVGYTTYEVTVDPKYYYIVSGFLEGGMIHYLFDNSGVEVSHSTLSEDTTFTDFLIHTPKSDTLYITNKSSVPFSILAVKAYKDMTFESTERSAEAVIQLPYEDEPLSENQTDSSAIQTNLNDPLFLPVMYRFKSAYNLESMSDLFVNKYYKFLDKNTGIMHKGFIYSLSLQLAQLRECEFQMLSYDI